MFLFLNNSFTFPKKAKSVTTKAFWTQLRNSNSLQSICSFENRTWNSKKWNFDCVPNFSRFGIFSQNHLYFQRWQIVLIYLLCCILTSLVSKMGSFIFQLWTVVLWWLITWGVISWNNTGTEIGFILLQHSSYPSKCWGRGTPSWGGGSFKAGGAMIFS